MSHTTPPPTSNPFTKLQRHTFDVVTSVMGYVCTWGAETRRVGFKNPTEEMRLAGVDYDPSAWVMEYRDDHFTGLEAAVAVRGAAEVVEIEGREYYVRKISRKFDGRTFVAELQPKPPAPPPPPPPDPDPDPDPDPTPTP